MEYNLGQSQGPATYTSRTYWPADGAPATANVFETTRQRANNNGAVPFLRLLQAASVLYQGRASGRLCLLLIHCTITQRSAMPRECAVMMIIEGVKHSRHAIVTWRTKSQLSQKLCNLHC